MGCNCNKKGITVRKPEKEENNKKDERLKKLALLKALWQNAKNVK